MCVYFGYKWETMHETKIVMVAVIFDGILIMQHITDKSIGSIYKFRFTFW